MRTRMCVHHRRLTLASILDCGVTMPLNTERAIGPVKAALCAKPIRSWVDARASGAILSLGPARNQHETI